MLLLQMLDTLADDQSGYQLKDRLSFMRFVGLARKDRVPDAKTIWLYREQLTWAGTVEHLFARFDATLREAGYLAMGGQIVDATVVPARRPRLSESEKATVTGGGVPATWSKAKRAQIDTEGRWTIKRGRRRLPRLGEPRERVTTEIAVPVSGDKNHVGLPPRLHPELCGHRCQPRTMVGSLPGCSTPAATPAGRGRGALEPVFAAQKCRLGVVIRSVGLVRATARLGLANLVTNIRPLVCFETRAAGLRSAALTLRQRERRRPTQRRL